MTVTRLLFALLVVSGTAAQAAERIKCEASLVRICDEGTCEYTVDDALVEIDATNFLIRYGDVLGGGLLSEPVDMSSSPWIVRKWTVGDPADHHTITYAYKMGSGQPALFVFQTQISDEIGFCGLP